MDKFLPSFSKNERKKRKIKRARGRRLILETRERGFAHFYQFLHLLIFVHRFFSFIVIFVHCTSRVYIRVCIGVGERIKPRDYTTWRINSEYEDNRRNVGEIIKIHVALDTYIKYTASFYKYCCCLKNLNLILINVD